MLLFLEYAEHAFAGLGLLAAILFARWWAARFFAAQREIADVHKDVRETLRESVDAQKGLREIEGEIAEARIDEATERLKKMAGVALDKMKEALEAKIKTADAYAEMATLRYQLAVAEIGNSVARRWVSSEAESLTKKAKVAFLAVMLDVAERKKIDLEGVQTMIARVVDSEHEPTDDVDVQLVWRAWQLLSATSGLYLYLNVALNVPVIALEEIRKDPDIEIDDLFITLRERANDPALRLPL